MIKLLLLLFLFGFAISKEIMATTYPVYYPLLYMIGERHKVEVFIKGKADPHHYELTPKDAQRLSKAHLVFTLGVEVWERRLLKELPKSKVVVLKEGINFVNYGKLPDPHVWLSPKRYAKVVSNIKDALVNWDKEGKEYYQKRYKDFMKRLKELDSAYSETLKRCKSKTLVSTHRAWEYLAMDYGLKTVSLSGVHAEEEPKPSEIKKVIDVIRKEGLKYIFAELGEDTKVANFIANQTGAKILPLNSSLYPEKPGDDYFTLMEKNLRALKEGLVCQ